MTDVDWNEILDPIIACYRLNPSEVAGVFTLIVEVYQLGIQQGKFAQAIDSLETGK